MGVVTRHDTATLDNKLVNSKQSRTPIFGSKQRRPSDCYRVFSQDIPSDITVEVGGTTFRLHKFPLVSRSGWMRKLVAEATETDVSRLTLPDIPGGAEAFELAAKFCYGTSFEMKADNIAMLRCAAEYLAMTEKYGSGNLIERTEAYINNSVISSLSNCVKVLQTCESLLPLAEELQIVARCVDAAAEKASKEQCTASFSQSELSACSSGRLDSIDSPVTGCTPRKRSIESWAEELCALRIDFFQRVLGAMRERGLRYDALAGAIVHYAQRSLRGLTKRQVSREIHPRSNGKVHDAAVALEHEQRVLLETIVSLLPTEKNTASTTFLFGLLRAAIHLDTTIACRLDLERRIGIQLEQASLDDLLIPNHSYNGDTLFDVDAVRRIVMNFLQQSESGEDDLYDTLFMYDPHSACSPPQSSMMKVARLLDCYMAEIAPDANLSSIKFIAIAKLMPEHARVVDDGLYRAIDIYLKAHPGVSEGERKNICARMDCGKLTQEACKHAAQNERLPVQVVVQVLYFEQMRLKNAMGGSMEAEAPAQGGALAVPDYAAVCKENRELKLEMARMRIHLGQDVDKTLHDEDDKLAADKALPTPPSNKSSNKLLHSFSKTLSKLNPFARSSSDATKVSHSKPSRPRRHSIS